MSFHRSNSSTSSSSSVTTGNGQVTDPSNVLYNDSEHYEIIFKNDSRFLDTSLHLFQSYRQHGYVPSETGKTKRRLFSSPSSGSLKPRSNGPETLSGTKKPGFSSNHNLYGTVNGTLKPTFTRTSEQFNSYRHSPSSGALTTPKPLRPTVPVTLFPLSRPVTTHGTVCSVDSLDEPDILVTRL